MGAVTGLIHHPAAGGRTWCEEQSTLSWPVVTGLLVVAFITPKGDEDTHACLQHRLGTTAQESDKLRTFTQWEPQRRGRASRRHTSTSNTALQGRSHGPPRAGGTHGSGPREPAGFQNVLYPRLGSGYTSDHVYRNVSDCPLEVPALTLCKFYLNKEVEVYDTQIYRAGRIRQER